MRKAIVAVDAVESKPYIEFLRGTRVVFDDAPICTRWRAAMMICISEHFR